VVFLFRKLGVHSRLKNDSMPRPDLSLAPSYFHNYINQVAEDELLTALYKQSPELIRFFENIPEEKQDFAYAPGKWTLKDLLQHIIDAERIFTYRALRIARKDSTPLAGFDEELYAQTAQAGKRSWDDLLDELKAVRKATEILFASFDENQLAHTGISSNESINVLSIGFITVGHCNHHTRIIKERYL
jgi:DinB superfamily